MQDVSAPVFAARVVRERLLIDFSHRFGRRRRDGKSRPVKARLPSRRRP
jgi:hypothetical protein